MTKAASPVPSAEVAEAMAAPAAVEAPAVKEEAPPAYARLGVTPSAILSNLRIVDAETGKRIDKVIEADAENDRVVRYVIEDGALVREGDRFQTVEEQRKILIEWATGNQKGSF